MAALQVLQRGVRDEGAVVQLDHLQAVVSAGSAAEVSDAIVGDQLAVRQALRGEDGGQELCYSGVCQSKCAPTPREPTEEEHQDSPGLAGEGSG